MQFRGHLTYLLFLALVFEVFCKEAHWLAVVIKYVPSAPLSQNVNPSPIPIDLGQVCTISNYKS